MMRRFAGIASWLLGIAAVAVIAWYFKPDDFSGMWQAVGVTGVAAWVALTLLARLAHGETTVIPVRALGHRIERADVFWIGWIRTFASQILPLAGIAAYAHAVRKRTGISWSSLAALATPQFVLAATALGTIGVLAVVLNAAIPDSVRGVLLLAYSGLLFASLLIALGAERVLRLLPFGLAERARDTATTLSQLAQAPWLPTSLVVFHATVILLRGLRLWLLFELTGSQLDWQQALLLVAIAESTMLIQLTPGSLGLREGAILGGAALVGIAAPVAAGVALIDRLLVVSITALLTPPALRVLRPSASA